MLTIGLIREGKIPADNRVALTPAQCKWITRQDAGVRVIAQSSQVRCFSDKEYRMAGVEVKEDISEADILMGIKEVPVEMLLADKTYLFFSHTKKQQPHNRPLFRAMMDKRVTLVDYECLEHEDGQRILGFGFFAGVVGAHNGMMAYGTRSGSFQLHRVFKQRSFRELIHSYFGLKVPRIKIAITGSGRVAHGVLEVMNLMGIIEVEPDEFLEKVFSYPVFTQLKGPVLYAHSSTGQYNREDFHAHPGNYKCLFEPYTRVTDVLMNGIYWDKGMPQLFSWEQLRDPRFHISTIADITDDKEGSVPCNLGDQSIEQPIYGVDRQSGLKTAPYLPGSVDMMAVGNLPNELPRDASRYFGEQLIKYILEDLVKGGSEVIGKATMLNKGILTDHFSYLQEYASGR